MNILWQPHPGPQRDFCSRFEFEVFYGGAAGGGKTDCIIAEALRDVHQSDYKALITRRTFPELEEVMDRCERLYPELGGEYHSGKKRWVFPSGASIRLGHMQRERDKYRYKSDEYQFIGHDEATELSPTQYLYLFSRCRTRNPNIKPRIRAGSNPGGPGHQFIKDRFKIGLLKPGTTIIDPATGLSRVFIPAKLKDNPTLIENDPDYVKRLMQLPEIERMRLLEGMWDAFDGQAFPELNIDVHSMEKYGITPHDIPKEWPRYRTFDWGYSTPFSVGWWAVDFDGRLYRYREWYGAKTQGENVGSRMSPAEIARGIKDREQGEKVMPGPADPDIWNPRWATMGKGNKFGVIGGSVAEDMQHEGVMWLKADNDHMQGRNQVHKRFELDEEKMPQVLVSVQCTDFWRTMPLLRESDRNPEDIESKNVENHVYDETRYMFMFKPIKPRTIQATDAGSFQAERRKYIKARQMAARHGIDIAAAYGKIR